MHDGVHQGELGSAWSMVEREISQGSISSTSDGAERIGERK
jgi:hypothetical protein